jgi:TrmH family RNA methyltransferase
VRLLTLARDLKRRKARERQHLFVSEGVRAVEELLRSPLKVRGALIAPQLRDAPRGLTLEHALRDHSVELAEVNPHEFASAAETESPQGILAIAEVPARTLDAIPKDGDGSRVLVLDSLQDPGNVGPILRTAAAFGVAATVAVPGTVDLWNAKVVRSAMGAHFHHFALASTWDELDAFRAERAVSLWATDVAGEAIDHGTAAPSRLALVVGNEGHGVSSAARQRAERLVGVRIASSVESLNVAVATGILLYELRR